MDPFEGQLDDFENRLSQIRHNVRNALTPALLVGERLMVSKDPAQVRAGEVINKSVERAVRLIKNDQTNDS